MKKRSAYLSVISIFTLAILFVGLMSSCGDERSDPYKKGSSGKITKKTIEKNIDSLGARYWDKTNYTNIITKQIDKSSTLRPTEKQSLKSRLDRTYADVLVRDANKIMSGTCSSEHSDLNAIMKELESFNKFNSYTAGDKENVKTRKSVHDEQNRFSVSTTCNVSDWRDSYDSGYDSEKLQEAAAIRATNPTCKSIQQKVDANAVRKKLAQRKEYYYRRIVDLYCQQSSWNSADDRIIRSRIRNSSNYTALKEKIEQFREKHEPKTNY